MTNVSQVGDVPLIRLEGIARTYEVGAEAVHALREVSLAVHHGEWLAIVGQSGSGKSTLMNLIGCLDTPTSGHYFLNERDVSRMSDDELADVRNQEIGFVFQTFQLLPRDTALGNVELPLIYRGVSTSERHVRAKAALDVVGMSDRMDHRPNELSGGEQQRVAIARALAGSPAVILADEPTGALDSKTGTEILNILQRLNAEQGLTLVMVTHDAKVAAYAKRILHMSDGELTDDRAIEQEIVA